LWGFGEYVRKVKELRKAEIRRIQKFCNLFVRRGYGRVAGCLGRLGNKGRKREEEVEVVDGKGKGSMKEAGIVILTHNFNNIVNKHLLKIFKSLFSQPATHPKTLPKQPRPLINTLTTLLLQTLRSTFRLLLRPQRLPRDTRNLFPHLLQHYCYISSHL
jgi:hypothetical protein